VRSLSFSRRVTKEDLRSNRGGDAVGVTVASAEAGKIEEGAEAVDVSFSFPIFACTLVSFAFATASDGASSTSTIVEGIEV
jgi:hypothetical protein